jgi:predicted ATPase
LLELAAISEGGLVARSLADLFQLPEFPGYTPLEPVITYLQPKVLLLIVDNCEHLIATCADLVERLLQTAANLHILATSREALNSAGEHEWLVLPLSTPTGLTADESGWSLTQLQPFAAAQAVKADLRFTDQDAPLIAHLCQQVDGILLALELAARCKSFTLPELVARLQDCFTLLKQQAQAKVASRLHSLGTIFTHTGYLAEALAALTECLAL